MNRQCNLDRREFLHTIGYGAGALAASSLITCTTQAASDSEPDLVIALRAVQAEAQIKPGELTRVWMYQGEVVKGNPASLQPVPRTAEVSSSRQTLRRVITARGSASSQRLNSRNEAGAERQEVVAATYLGPVIRVKRGQRVRINFTNQLPEATIIHWHGLYVPERMDGHPRDAVAPGQSYVYEFDVTNRAGTYWFHPHPDQRTGSQVYQGLAGMFLVSDEEEAAIGLPSGGADFPLIIQDRLFNGNQFAYQTGMMTAIMGMLGDQILINGQPDFKLTVGRRPYRFRLLNGSNARVYKLAWSDGRPLTVIATDGGLLERAVTRNYVMLAPGERLELLADFSEDESGMAVELRSLAFSGAGDGGAGIVNGAPLTLLRVELSRGIGGGSFTMPSTLSSISRHRREDAVNAANPRTITAALNAMRWTLNNRTFELEAVATNEIAQAGTLDLWEFVNNTGGMMSMLHPLHIHGPQFQVLERVPPANSADYNTVSDGFVDDGWKDTVIVMPGERVRLLLRYGQLTGLFIYHCHILEHEDGGMMRNYQVRA